MNDFTGSVSARVEWEGHGLKIYSKTNFWRFGHNCFVVSWRPSREAPDRISRTSILWEIRDHRALGGGTWEPCNLDTELSGWQGPFLSTPATHCTVLSGEGTWKNNGVNALWPAMKFPA